MNACRLSDAWVEVPHVPHSLCLQEHLSALREAYSDLHVCVWVLADMHDAIVLLAHGNKTVGEISSNVWKEVG